MDTETQPAAGRLPGWLTALLRWRTGLWTALVIVVGVALLFALKGLTHEFSYAAMVEAMHGTSTAQIWLAVLATGVSYVALSGYDYSALRYVGARLSYGTVLQTSFIAYALGNTIGLGMLTGGAVRMRMYAAAGIPPDRIVRIVAFNAVAFGSGIAVVGAMTLAVRAAAMAPLLHMPVWLLRLIGGCILLAAAAALWICSRPEQRARRWSLVLPSSSLVLQQLLISAVDVAASAAVLWVLLPPGGIGFVSLLGFYSMAVLLGVFSHVPGGLGLFEATMLLALKGRVPAGEVAGALVLYRIIYYVLPLGLALVMLMIYEVRRTVAAPIAKAAVGLAPTLLTAFTLVVAVMLLLSGVTPATREAEVLLSLHVPLPLVEASHFLGSVAGLVLLLAAYGMLQRLDVAWWIGVVVAAISAVLALPKGVAISEAIPLALLTLALALSRRQFNRKASLFAQRFSTGWLLSVGAILAAVTGVLFFAYRDVAYAQELWWQFAFDAHAPRSLRALMAVTMLTLLFAVRQLLRPSNAALPLPDAAALDRCADIVRQQDSAEACLVLVGDKHLLFSDSGRAFLMFGRHRRSWVALFDPVGPANEWPELVWKFIERVREHGGRASFYQVRPQSLPMYLDAGLRVFKLGEYAYVPLHDFSLQGSQRAKLRQSVNRAQREGLSFAVVEAADPSMLEELAGISRAWLAEHQAAEKGFSLGSFNERYVLRQPVAVARCAGQTVAFATLMITDQRCEASVDLMRHVPNAPSGTMDFLFAQLLLYLRQQGYQRFGLGMAPLSGMQQHPLAPRWHRIGSLLFAHAEPFYNFQGLRAFKEKFAPVWEPRYLATSSQLSALITLTDTAALIAGGLRGVIAK